MGQIVQPEPAQHADVESRFRDGARLAAPLLPAVLAFGVSFGVLARASGMGRVAPVLMSLTTFAGSAQFAVASVLGDGGGVAAAVVAALLLNARYLAIGVSVAPGFRGPRVARLLQSQLVIDESWALGRTPDGRPDRRLMIGAGALIYAGWTTGTVAGVIGGGAFGSPEALGLDAAFPALFLALLVPQVRGRRPLVAALAGGLVALVLLPLAPPGVPIIAAAAVAVLGLRR